MINEDLLDKLKETLVTCELHHKRMVFAYQKMQSLLPLDKEGYDNLTSEQISFSDQLIYRFSKLQDIMGQKLFRLILKGLGEEIENLPFIDILNMMEKLQLIEDHKQWLMLRETRNLVTHEYPFNKDEFIEGLNELSN